MSRFIIAFACLTVALAASAERYEFDRYQAIVDRQMFGPLPEGFDPSKPPSEVQKSAGGRSERELTKEQEQVKKSVRFSMINLNPKGETMVGFTDNSNPKEVRHYYLKVGESRDGWTVKAADAVAATVSISKDGVDLDLELGSGSSGNAPAAGGSAAPAAGGGLGGLGRRGGLLGGGAAGAGGGRFSAGAGSLRERRMAKLQQREANEKAAAEDQAKRDAEAAAEKAKAEEEKAQREAEREQQRQQLMQIQEELKKAREARQAAEAAEKENADSSATSDE